MRRAIIAAVVLVLLAGAVVFAPGCGKEATVGTIDNAAASASPAEWAKVVELAGSLNGANRGRAGVTVALTGSALRFDLTYGSAPGWGANRASMRWWLYPVSDTHKAQPAVPLHVVSKRYSREQDATTLTLEPGGPLIPGSYQLLYQGSGWYSMAIYQR
jgi:hypothetical protein